ncbi:transcription factor TFIIF complex subunit Tfg3, partial [Tieghemiomyces parasiticus]
LRYDLPYIAAVVFELHPTFPNPKPTIREAPFQLLETGWGEFDLKIHVYFKDENVPSFTFQHDLNFRRKRYEMSYTLDILSPDPHLLTLLDASYPTRDVQPHKLSTAGPKTKRKEKKKPAPVSPSFADNRVPEAKHESGLRPGKYSADASVTAKAAHRFSPYPDDADQRDIHFTPGRSALTPARINPFTAAHGATTTPNYGTSAGSSPLTSLASPATPAHPGGGTADPFQPAPRPRTADNVAPSVSHSTTMDLSDSAAGGSGDVRRMGPEPELISSDSELWRRMSALAERLQNLPLDGMAETVEVVRQLRLPTSYVNESLGDEFHFDLFTLPDELLDRLWAITSKYLGPPDANFVANGHGASPGNHGPGTNGGASTTTTTTALYGGDYHSTSDTNSSGGGVNSVLVQ